MPSAEEDQRLASFQSNAGHYWEMSRLDQALGMCDRGLEIDPEDYKLRSIQAAVHLRMSPPPTSPDQRMLDLCLDEFDELLSRRSLRHHEPFVLFLGALARQKQGMRLLREAEEQRIGGGMPARKPDPGGAERTRELADGQFASASELLEDLLDRGTHVRLTHYHLMQLAAARGHYSAMIEHGQKYLEQAAKEQLVAEGEIERTMTFGWEIEQKQTLQSLRAEELEVRAFLARQLYGQRQLEEALKHLDAVLHLDPTRSVDHYNRGRLLRELGRTEEAREDLRTFLATTSLPADSPQVVDAVQMLTRQQNE